MRQLVTALLFPLVAAAQPPQVQTDLERLETAGVSATRLEAEGQPASAARALEAVLSLFPGDYDLLMRLGRLWLAAEDVPRAEGYYQRAHDVSGGGPEPRVGLGWCALARGDTDTARARFREILAETPEHAEAQRGLAACDTGVRLVPSLWGAWTGVFWSGHPIKSSAQGAAAGASLAIGPSGHVAAAWRFARVGVRSTPLRDGEPFDYHEVFLTGGYATDAWGLSGTWGLALDDSSEETFGNIVGLRGRVSPLGDVALGLSLALFDDLTVFRADFDWRVPVGRGFWVEPGVSLDAADGSVSVAGSLTAGWTWSWLDLWVHGRYGEEVKPVYLSIPTVYAVTDTLLYAAAAGVTTRLGAGLALDLTYEWARLRTGDSDPIESNQHGVVFTLSWTLPEATP